MDAIETLINLASDSLCKGAINLDRNSVVYKALWELLLCNKDGFYAYEKALLVRPFSNQLNVLGIVEWNNDSTWKGLYNIDLTEHIFFSENIFGEQYSLTAEGVYFFDPETGGFEKFSDNLEEWAFRIVEDPDFHAGHQIAHEWQNIHGILSFGERLGPITPFVVGGGFEVNNLRRFKGIELMKFRAQISNQISELPDGAEIDFQITD